MVHPKCGLTASLRARRTPNTGPISVHSQRSPPAPLLRSPALTVTREQSTSLVRHHLPASVSKRVRRIAMLKSSSIRNLFSVCTAIAIVICTFIYYFHDIENWRTSPDTHSYVGDDYFAKPWNSMRTPGMSLFWEVIGVKDALKKATRKYRAAVDFNTLGRKEEKTNSLGKKLVVANITLIGVSFAFLCFALSTSINPLLSFVFVITSMCFGAIPEPRDILADLPACSFTAIFVALFIFYSKYKKNYLLFLLCCFSIFACLIKPGMFFLPLIAGCILLYEILRFIRGKSFKKALTTFCIGVFLIFGTLFWPILLYVHSGFFVSSQLSSITKNMFAVYLLEEGDEQLFTDPKQRAFVAALIAHKPEADAEIDELVYKEKKRSEYSQAHIYMHSVNFYGHRYFYKICRENGYDKLSSIDHARLSNEISTPIIKKHFRAYLKTVGRSFISAFGIYKDLPASIFWRLDMGNYALPLSIGTYLFLFCAILFGINNLQYLLVLLTSLHIASVLFMSIGHAVLGRYLTITEWSFILALEVGMYSLILKIFPALSPSGDGRGPSRG